MKKNLIALESPKVGRRSMRTANRTAAENPEWGWYVVQGKKKDPVDGILHSF